MEFAYEPDNNGVQRPIVGVRLEYNGAEFPFPVKCLVDTGATHSILRWEIGENLGIDLDCAADYGQDLALGGSHRKKVKVVHLSLTIGTEGDALRMPDVEVLFVRGELPVSGVLGASTLRHAVTVFREYEAILHIRPAGDFCNDGCPHYCGLHPL